METNENFDIHALLKVLLRDLHSIIIIIIILFFFANLLYKHWACSVVGM